MPLKTSSHKIWKSELKFCIIPHWWFLDRISHSPQQGDNLKISAKEYNLLTGPPQLWRHLLREFDIQYLKHQKVFGRLVLGKVHSCTEIKFLGVLFYSKKKEERILHFYKSERKDTNMAYGPSSQAPVGCRRNTIDCISTELLQLPFQHLQWCGSITKLNIAFLIWRATLANPACTITLFN